MNKPWRTPARLLIIAGIFLLGATLRFYHLGAGEILGDEPTYSVRSQGWVDTLASDTQTTPYQWFDVVPWWTKLSFHDHPPLVFWFQWLAQAIAGPGIVAARAVSVIFGIATIYILYILTKRLTNAQTAMWAAIVWSVNVTAVSFSRWALMESVSVFFILLTTYAALRTRDNRQWWYYFGACLGLSLLAKYTSAFFIPLYVLITAWHNQGWWRQRHVHLSALITLAILSPVIIYNFYLWKHTGHFDVQLASLFGQHTPEWTNLLGKETGSIAERVRGMGHIITLTSPLFLLCAAWGLYQSKKENDSTRLPLLYFFTATGISVLILWLVAGSAARFLFYLIPFLAIAAGITWSWLVSKPIGKWVVGALLAFEIAFTVNTVIVPITRTPFGQPILTYAPNLIVKNWGIVQLDEFFNKALQNKHSTLTPQTNYPALNHVIAQAVTSTAHTGEASNIFLGLDPQVDIRTLLHVYTRRTLYEAWPVISGEQLPQIIDMLKSQNISATIYYAEATENTIKNPLVTSSFSVGDFLKNNSRLLYSITPINRPDGLTAFNVYTITLAK